MRSHREPLAVSTCDDFLQGLRASGLLPPEAVEALAVRPGRPDPRARASELVERGLLTGYQAEQILAGNADSLVLGQYRILDELGAGGMGRVYKAEHVLMRRAVALKVVGAAGDGEHHAAFLREIEAAARLSHPHLVAAYDAGEANGVRFLVMEYVDGIDLDRLVRAVGPLPPRRAAEYARQTALALQYAFERGVLHRDVKPANLLAEQADDPRAVGRVKLLDLGLALTTCPGAESDPGAVSRLSGTPDYIAPEVAHDPAGRDVRSDLYSLGCTLYYLLAGRVPFPGGTWTEKLLRHQYDAPAPLRDLVPAVPPALAAVVARLMAKAPADRYDTPAAAARALEDWLALGEDPPAARPAADPAAPAERRAAPAPMPHPGPSSAWDLPLAAPPLPRSQRRLRHSRHLRWLPVVAVAVSLGLAGAWWVRARLSDRGVPAAPAPAGPPFIVAGSQTAHTTLAAAVAAAGDGDTVTIRGEGPFLIEPIIVTGKALTLRAAPGSRPSLYFARPAAAWQALVSSDRPLALEGLDLHEAPGDEPAHLVCVTGGSLRLIGCKLTAPRRAAPVVARGAGRVELRDCQVRAGGLALCAEVVPGVPCEVVLTGNRIEVRDTGAAALSVWAGDRHAEPTCIEMEANEVRAPRVLSLGELTAGVAAAARHNRFDFREALLCANGFAEPDGWRRAVTWQGRENHYRGPGDWLCVDGQPAGARGFAAWQGIWGAEPESAEER
jgi:serine/threonine-protein kinase